MQGHVVFERGTTKTRPCSNSSPLVHFLGLAYVLQRQERTTSPGAFHKRVLRSCSCMQRTHSKQMFAETHLYNDKQWVIKKKYGDHDMQSGVQSWMPKVQSMLLSAVILYSPPPPLSPVQISHFLQAQC